MAFSIVNDAEDFYQPLGRWFQAPDNSMAPVVNKGDDVWCVPPRLDDSEGVFVLNLDGQIVIRRMSTAPLGGLRIEPENRSEYREVHLSPAEIRDGDFEVLASVVRRIGRVY